MIVDTLQKGYAEIGRTVLTKGARTKSRATGASKWTREIIGFDLHVADPRKSLPVGTGRRLHPAVGVVEALQLTGGWSDPQLQCRVAPNMASFMDAGVFHGAYGLRIAQQVPQMIDRLRSDDTSRQAVLTIWDPIRDGADGPHDLPCTISVQFLNRNDTLHCVTNMRSNDFWWGLAYDVFQFTQLQLTLAHFLGLDVGWYHHVAGSFHAYERDWDAIDDLHEPTVEHPCTPGFARDEDRKWADVRARTRDLVSTDPAVTAWERHQWYRSTMQRFV